MNPSQAQLFITDDLRVLINTAKEILCLETEAQSACGICRSCVLLEEQTHPDLLMLKTDKSDKIPRIKTEQISDALRALQTTSKIGPKQVVVIESAETMTQSAANGLLKNLEEPKKGLYWLLQTNKPRQLLPTINSRVQKVYIDHKHEESIDIKKSIYHMVKQTNNHVDSEQNDEEILHKAFNILVPALLTGNISPIQLSENLKDLQAADVIKIVLIVYYAYLATLHDRIDIYQKFYIEHMANKINGMKAIDKDSALRCVTEVEKMQEKIASNIVPTHHYIVEDLFTRLYFIMNEADRTIS